MYCICNFIMGEPQMHVECTYVDPLLLVLCSILVSVLAI